MCIGAKHSRTVEKVAKQDLYVVSSAYCVSRIPPFLDKPHELFPFFTGASSVLINVTIGSEIIVALALASKINGIRPLEVKLRSK